MKRPALQIKEVVVLRMAFRARNVFGIFESLNGIYTYIYIHAPGARIYKFLWKGSDRLRGLYTINEYENCGIKND